METFLTFLIFGAIATIVIAAVVFRWHLKEKRRKEIMAFADAHAMKYSVYDIDNVTVTHHFELFERGDGRRAENFVSGRWRDRYITAADFWYYTESTNEKGARTRRYSYFQIAIVPIAAYLPRISITAENVLTRLADHAGFHDINFESDEFNRAFNIRAPEREFAFKFIDARMMQWLLYCGNRYCFETGGPDLLVYTKRTKPREIPKLLEVAVQTIERIPRLVWEDYKIDAPEAG